jgi:hypothetical protein
LNFRDVYSLKKKYRKKNPHRTFTARAPHVQLCGEFTTTTRAVRHPWGPWWERKKRGRGRKPTYSKKGEYYIYYTVTGVITKVCLFASE